MTHAETFATRLVAALTGDEHAPIVFDRSEKTVAKYLKTEDGQKAVNRLYTVIHEEAAKLDANQFLSQLEDYAFLLPKKERDAALAAYDACGSVQVTITRDANVARVQVKKLGADIAQDPRLPGSISGQFSEQPQPAAVKMAAEEEKADFAGVQEPQKGQPAAVSEPTEEQRAQTQPVDNKPKRKVAFLFPTCRDVNPHVVKGIMGQMQRAYDLLGRGEVPFFDQTDTVIDRARNILATRFLEESDADWSFWMDSDMIVPYGNPAWYREKAESSGNPCTYPGQFISQNALEKMTQGPHKFVSAVYATRSKHRKHCNQLGLAPKSEAEANFCNRLRKGPRTEYKELDWVGFGCVAVHRQVFLDVQKACPELAPKRKGEPWNFFTGELACSEDVAFCRRAVKAGHRPVLDLSIFALHIGNAAFLP